MKQMVNLPQTCKRTIGDLRLRIVTHAEWERSGYPSGRSNNQRSAAGHHAAKNDDLGAAGIALSLRDGRVGTSHGMEVE
jgi:hypothetical protein